MNQGNFNNQLKEELKLLFVAYQKRYEQLKHVELLFIPYNKSFNYEGRSQIDIVGSFKISGKNRYKSIKPLSIELIEGYSNIKYTLLHEISHCIGKYRERKVKDEWISLDHADDFYSKYHEVLNFAFEKKFINKKFQFHEIKKFDITC
eukprot:gene5058-8653_t